METQDRDAFDRLVDAAGLERRAEVESLLAQEPALIDARNGLGETAMHFLVVEDHAGGVRMLLEFGADVNARNEFLGTPLHDAAQLGNAQMVRLLLASGADG